MLSVNNVCVNYGKSQIVSGINFELNSDDKMVILGRNGVGKTTFLKSIIGLLSFREGSLTMDNKDITKYRAHERSRSGIAYVPQGREIIPQLTVKENLELGSMAHKVNYEEKVKEVFEYFPILKEHIKRKGGVLSGGQQQQLAIARALMGNPKVLILDEPTEGIQPNIVSEIAGILTRYHEEKNVPLIIVEQNLKFARKLGNRFIIMQKGSIVKAGNIEELTDEMSKKYLSV